MSNSNLPLGTEFDKSAPWNETEEYECPECGNPVSSYGMTCSIKCHKASMI